MFRDFAARVQWTAADVLDRHTWAEFYVTWLGGSGLRAGAEVNGDLKAQINKRRAAKGLPPMQPQPKKKR
jgi:hypothetical protein